MCSVHKPKCLTVKIRSQSERAFAFFSERAWGIYEAVSHVKQLDTFFSLWLLGIHTVSLLGLAVSYFTLTWHMQMQ